MSEMDKLKKMAQEHHDFKKQIRKDKAELDKLKNCMPIDTLELLDKVAALEVAQSIVNDDNKLLRRRINYLEQCLEDAEAWNGREKLQQRITELKSENEKLTTRCYPSKVIMIGDTGHYVSEAVAEQVAKLEAELFSRVRQLRVLDYDINEIYKVRIAALENKT